MYFIKVRHQQRMIQIELEHLGCTRPRARYVAKNAFSALERPWYVKLYIKYRNSLQGLIHRLTPWEHQIDYQLAIDLYKRGLLYISPNDPILNKIKEDE